MRNNRRYRYQAQKPNYKVYTKLQLIKKLKEDNNYNWDFVSKLNSDSDYIYSKGSAYDLYNLTDRGIEGAYKRIDAVLELVKETFPEPALARERAWELEYAIDSIEKYAKAEDVTAVQALVKTLLRTATTEEIDDFSFFNLKYDITAEEYISISVRASVWSYYISGSIELLGKTFTAENVSYRSSDATRI